MVYTLAAAHAVALITRRAWLGKCLSQQGSTCAAQARCDHPCRSERRSILAEEFLRMQMCIKSIP